MIVSKELLKVSTGTPPAEAMQEMLKKLNIFRSAYGKPMIPTSYYRSPEKQREIYAKKGITDESKIPMGSMHLKGLACDFGDSKGELDDFCQKNVALLENIGLWVEAPEYTKGWCHIQIRPPKSLKRFFIP